MLLPEVLKKLCELQMRIKDNGGSKINDISVVQEGNYGYVIVLTSFRGNIHDEVLSAKLLEMKGKKILPDLWVFGPGLKEEKIGESVTHPDKS